MSGASCEMPPAARLGIIATLSSPETLSYNLLRPNRSCSVEARGWEGDWKKGGPLELEHPSTKDARRLRVTFDVGIAAGLQPTPFHSLFDVSDHFNTASSA